MSDLGVAIHICNSDPLPPTEDLPSSMQILLTDLPILQQRLPILPSRILACLLRLQYRYHIDIYSLHHSPLVHPNFPSIRLLLFSSLDRVSSSQGMEAVAFVVQER